MPLLARCTSVGRALRARVLVVLLLACAAEPLAAQTIAQRYRVRGGPTLRGIAAGPAGLIAVGDGGLIVASADGTSWESRHEVTTTLRAIAFGHDRYVAVGDAGRIFHSIGGLNWFLALSDPTTQWNAVAYAGHFVAVGENGAIASTVGTSMSWRRDESPTRASLRAIAPGAPNVPWFSVVGAGGTWLHDASGSWVTALSETTVDLQVLTTDLYSYYISSGGNSYQERRAALAGAADGSLRWLTRTSFGPFTDPQTFLHISPTTARIRCIVAGRTRAVDRWHPSFSNSTTTFVTQHILVDELGRVFVSVPREPGANIIRAWSALGTIPDPIVGGTWSAADNTFYLVGENSSIYAIPTDPSPPWGLANAAVRGFVSPAQGPLIAGFIVPGDTDRRVLVRGIGPGLAAFGVPNVLARPRLGVFNGTTAIASAAELGDDPRASVLRAETLAAGAFAAHEHDAVLLLTLAPGAWTAVLTSADTTPGAALIEVYVLP